jgi:hypothetical protein
MGGSQIYLTIITKKLDKGRRAAPGSATNCVKQRPCTILKGMDAERTRAFLLTLGYVVESGSQTRRWGDKLVFRVGAQANGGKMFAQFDFAEDGELCCPLLLGLIDFVRSWKEMASCPRHTVRVSTGSH